MSIKELAYLYCVKKKMVKIQILNLWNLQT